MSLTILRETTREKPCVRIWRGKQGKPYANFLFRTLEQREQYITREKASEEARDKFKAEQRAKQEMKVAENKNDIQKGSILYSSWGYDQTNIDFYQVTDKKGCFVWVREIAQSSEADGFMSEKVIPIKDHFTRDSKEMKKKIGPWGLRFNSYCNAIIWDGRPKHATHYA